MMNSHSDNIFSHVRTKLRQSRSSVMLRTSTHTQHESSNWDHIPAEFRPVERAEVRVVNGYYLNRPFPRPPPRPRTTSPLASPGPSANFNTCALRNPTPRTHRTRSAETAQRRWSRLDDRDLDMQARRASVNIATALPPDHLEPPPAYSRHPDPPSTGPVPWSSTRHLHPQESAYIQPYDPNDYARPRSQSTRRTTDGIPIIAAPQPPTPVSPLNTLDYQYLNMRNQTHHPASNGNVTIENLLGHPMLQYR